MNTRKYFEYVHLSDCRYFILRIIYKFILWNTNNFSFAMLKNRLRYDVIEFIQEFVSDKHEYAMIIIINMYIIALFCVCVSVGVNTHGRRQM